MSAAFAFDSGGFDAADIATRVWLSDRQANILLSRHYLTTNLQRKEVGEAEQEQ